MEHIMQPDMLHGECVAVGIVKEARSLELLICAQVQHMDVWFVS